MCEYTYEDDVRIYHPMLADQLEELWLKVRPNKIGSFIVEVVRWPLNGGEPIDIDIAGDAAVPLEYLSSRLNGRVMCWAQGQANLQALDSGPFPE